MSDLPLWERSREWPLMRPFVYYLMENFVPARLVAGRTVVDFSAGLGDLTAHLTESGASRVIATVPDADVPGAIPDMPGVEWRPGVLASRIAESFEPGTIDVFCARMVFQFPRWEDAQVDVDVMLDQIGRVLSPGGRLVMATHAYFSLQQLPSLETEADADVLLDRLVQLSAGAPVDINEILTTEAQRILGLTEMVRYLGLPPREGPAGETGFGLKVPMLVQSFVRGGYRLEVVEDVEPFTYPLGVWEQFDDAPQMVRELGARVFAIKQRHLTSPAAGDTYGRPAVIGAMLQEVRWHVPIVWVPVVRIVAARP